MLAKSAGGVVLVAGALPGELVETRVERRRHGTVWARTERVLEPSPSRVGNDNPCGGNVLAHASYEHQLSLKQLIIQDGFARLARLPIDRPPIVPSPTVGYRMRARLHVRGRALGFYLEGTHTLCDPSTTGQLLPETQTVLAAITTALTEGETALAVDLAENRDASERALHVELVGDADPSRLHSVGSAAGISSLSVSHAGSPRVRTLTGEGRVTDQFISAGCAWSVSRTTHAFFQGNRYLLDDLVTHVVGSIEPGPVTDLYAGSGLFAIAAAAHGRSPVYAVEGDAVAAADLRRNSAEWRGLVEARHAPVEDYLHDRRSVRPRTLVLDPPRTGLSRRAHEGVVRLGAPRVIYVSCDVPTLARDTRVLTDAGYRLLQLTAFDLFPNTAHVEAVAVFER
jgi:23S rRNA (uracil1939-C5)-methyltransferase